MIEYQLRTLLQDEVTVFRATGGIDSYGNRVFDDGTEYRCRITGGGRRFASGDTEAAFQAPEIIFDRHLDITVGDLVQLPNGDQQPIRRIHQYPDQHGNHHTAVELYAVGERAFGL